MAGDLWDDRLRERLGDYAEQGAPPSWDDLARRLDQAAEPADPTDEPLRDALGAFRADGPVTGWDRIATTLDQADHAWEETLRRKVAAFEAPADPHGWTQFVGYWHDSRFVRTKLILLKGIEAMALLLILLTFTRQGAFDTPSAPMPIPAPAIAGQARNQEDSSPQATSPAAERQDGEAGNASAIQPVESPFAELPPAPAAPSTAGSTPTDASGPQGISAQAEADADGLDAIADHPAIKSGEIIEAAIAYKGEGIGQPATSSIAGSNPNPLPPQGEMPGETAPLDPIDILLAGEAPKLSMPEPGRQTGRSAAELSIFALADMSALRMSEERIFSLGQQVVFPEKRLYSQGFGGGITIATGHPRYALETGLLYSSRTFSPGRKVTLGNALDNSTVDFQALRLQLISVPLQGRYRLDRKGRVQTYAAGGMTFTVVAQSDLDVVSSYNFTSLAAGADPNSDPVIARTLRETRRISETLRDGAPFSSKNYVSVNAGFGLEYVIMNRKKIFLQAQAQYQIPNLEFSNHNGKDLRALIVQAGLRSSLGY